MKIVRHPTSTQIDATNEVTTSLSLDDMHSSLLVTAYYFQQGETALHIACIQNRFDMVKLLLKRGADINIRDKVILVIDVVIINFFRY